MTIYLAATSTPPEVICPGWCEVPMHEHLDQLNDWDGRAIHKTWRTLEGSKALHDFGLRAGVSLCTDGTPDGDPRNGLEVDIEGRSYTPAEARLIAQAILDLAEEVTAS